MTAIHNANKDKLINVAIDLFATKGFKGTSIRDIAHAMGMSISNIYHHFGSKEGLLLAILKHSSYGLVEGLRRVSDQNSDPLDRFKALVKTHVRLSADRKKESKIFFLDEEDLAPKGNEINRQIQLEVLDLYVSELRNLEAAGYIECRSLKIMAFNVLGVINWHLRWYHPDGPLSQEEVSREVLSFVLYGILGSRPDRRKSGEGRDTESS